jgi:hypothetical protein
VSLFVRRLTHHLKILVGNRLERILVKQYSRGRGPAGALISASSAEAKHIGVRQTMLIAPSPVKKSIPEFFLEGEIETGYRKNLLSGDDFTSSAGIISAQNVDISLPTGMHRIGNYILKEVMPAPYLLTNPKYYYGLESIRFKRKRPMEEGVLLSMPWHHNFYHWMIEILPRLILYDRTPNLQNVSLIVPKVAPKFVAESLKLAGYQAKAIFLDSGAYRFKKLHMMSILGQTMEVSTDAINWLNEKFQKTSPPSNVPKRIYISRRDAKIRFVSNESELAGVLSEFGFVTFVMSDLSLAEQIDLFSSAECIIGPHGAAFSNLAFSRAGSTFIEFYARGHYNPCFNRIAGIRSLKYGFLVGEPTEVGGFLVDPNHLRKVLAQAMHIRS